MSEIRSFRNSDLPAMVELLNQHHRRLGQEPGVRQSQLEQALLSRNFFDRETLWIASGDDGVPVGWIQGFPAERTIAARSRDGDDESIIAAICLGDTIDDATATRLLQSSKEHLARCSPQPIGVGVVCDCHLGYAGLAPYGYGYGVDESDRRTTALLERVGFVPQQAHVQLIADTMGYRAPVNREALKFRRSCMTQVEPMLVSDARRAVALSHLNVDRHRLIERQGGLLSELEVWSSDPEAEVMSPSRVIIQLADESLPPLDGATGYLLATILSQLGQRGIMTAESVIPETATACLQSLRQYGFQVAARGARWRCDG